MKDYSKGKIYTIRCRTDDTLIYVGSTVQPLSKRWGNHKADSRRERCKNILIYKTINGDWNNWKIELHSLYPCSCVEELERKEGEIIREIGTLNAQIQGRTHKEYYYDNKDKILENKKQYYEDNKEQKKVYQKEYDEANKEKKKNMIKRIKKQTKKKGKHKIKHIMKKRKH